MQRQLVLDRLKKYESFWATTPPFQKYRTLELDNIKRLVSFIDSTPQCFERTHAEGHITGSALVTNASLDKVLLTLHAKLGMWLQLGGHSDGDPDTAQVALREAQEEGGLTQIEFVPFAEFPFALFDVDIHWIPENKKEAGHFHYDLRFLLNTQNENAIQISNESKDLKWFTIPVARELTRELSMHRQFDKLEYLKSLS